MTPVPTSTLPTLMSADEFAVKHEYDRKELVRGLVMETPMPHQMHGKICARMAFYLTGWADENDCGHVMCNDSFVRTTRGPDSVRGPDVNYYSFERLPRGPVPPGLLDAVPELAVEVASPSNRLSELNAKTLEYFAAGVKVVIVFDPDMAIAAVYRDNENPQTFDNGDTLTVPDVLPGFAVPLAKLFA